VVPAATTPVRRSGPIWTPLAGPELLDRLRFTGRPRPVADAERADSLRQFLEEGLEPLGREPGVHEGSVARPPLVVTKARLTEAHSRPGPRAAGDRAPTPAIACGILIGVLFRQLITTGSIGDPVADGFGALAVDDRHADLLAWVGRLPDDQRRALDAEVRRQAEGLVRRWPALDPAWLPRTEEPMRADLAGGAVVLAARVDLAVGRPGLDVASVAVVEVKSGARRGEHRDDLGFYALIEALRHPAPPFAVATYYTRTGELDVEPVSDELLWAAADRTVAGALALAACTPPDGGERRVTGGRTLAGTGRPGEHGTIPG
jgi:hypothetical protein